MYATIVKVPTRNLQEICGRHRRVSTCYLDHLNLTYIIVLYSVKHGTDGWIESSVEAAEQWKVTALPYNNALTVINQKSSS